jgi:hypothetical protein
MPLMVAENDQEAKIPNHTVILIRQPLFGEFFECRRAWRSANSPHFQVFCDWRGCGEIRPALLPG